MFTPSTLNNLAACLFLGLSYKLGSTFLSTNPLRLTASEAATHYTKRNLEFMFSVCIRRWVTARTRKLYALCVAIQKKKDYILGDISEYQLPLYLWAAIFTLLFEITWIPLLVDYYRKLPGASSITELRGYCKLIPDVTGYPKLHELELGNLKAESVSAKPTDIISGYVRAGGRVLYILRKVLFGH